MKRLRCATGALLTLVLGAGAAANAADEPLAAFRADYEVLRNGDRLGVATVELNHVEGETWEFLTHTRGTAGLAGLAGAEITERSEFRWREALPELMSYRYEQHAAWKTRKRSLDVQGTRIASTDRDKRYTLPFEPGTIDRHTVVLALAVALSIGHADELRFAVADRDEVETQRYRFTGHERVDTPAGRFDATRVERIREQPGRTTTTWFAPQAAVAPVRVLQTEPDGDTIEMRLKRAD